MRRLGQGHGRRHADLITENARGVPLARRVLDESGVTRSEHVLRAVAQTDFELPGENDDELAAGGRMPVEEPARRPLPERDLIRRKALQPVGLRLAPVTIIAHSLGGQVALRYAGIYPDTVARLVAIEGLGPPPAWLVRTASTTIVERVQEWVAEQRNLAGRLPRRYASIEDAFRRMQEENPHLTAEQARHLTVHGVNQNEDGTYSWKFDNYVRAWPPYDMRARDIEFLWSRIDCPTLLLYGKESWSGNPPEAGRARHFRHAKVVGVDGAGHWLHHDRLDDFLKIIRSFLARG